MWTRWRMARPAVGRISTASSTALQRPAWLQVRATVVSGLPLHGRTFSTANESVQAGQAPEAGDVHARARRSIGDFSRTIRSARSAEDLTVMWSVLSRHEPVVVVDGDGLRPVGSLVDPFDETSPRVQIPTDSFAVRMVPTAEMLSLVHQGKRSTVIEISPQWNPLPAEMDTGIDSTENAESSLTITPTDGVVLVSELFVVRKILRALSRHEHHAEFTQFLEAYEAASLVVRSGTADPLAEELTTVGNLMDAFYIVALGKLRESAKMLERFQQQGGGDVSRILGSREALTSLLDACMMEGDGGLARRILDGALDRSALFTVYPVLFTRALKACLRGKTKSLEGLHNAAHIYRRMVHEAGYILQPTEWSLLFNACVYLGQKDLAIEIFRQYRTHGIAPFQRRFQFAIRMACRHAQYGVAVEMARAWIEIEAQHQPPRKPVSREDKARRRRRRADEAECLNKILWEMLKQHPMREHVEQVLVAMQSQGFQAGALVIRRVVTHFFAAATSDEDQLAPEAVLCRFFELWERVPDTIQRTSFVLHLVLDECASRGWTDQCERVLEYALENGVDLPLESMAKLMDLYATRGQFDEAIKLGELVLRPQLERAAKNRHNNRREKNRGGQKSVSFPDSFFESLLRCYLFLERFEDVVLVDDVFRLTKRRSGENAALATILRVAREMAN